MNGNNQFIFTVSELNQYVAALLAADPHLSQLTVRGEISGFKKVASGHMYFSLKDEQSVVSCVMFKYNGMSLRFVPKDGMMVTIHGYASVYSKDGRFQVYVSSMEKAGEGELMLRFLALKADYENKGYFDGEQKKPIPFLPQSVGVVTSGTGAVIQDIRNVIGRRFPKMPIFLYPVKVQGEGAADEIARGIHYFSEKGCCDVIIVGRGGGSIEDLWCFNEPLVAEAIHDCRIPVISAVGHETDFTIADFVADLRAPTPSAAAELAVPDEEELVGQLFTISRRLKHSLSLGMEKRRSKLERLYRDGMRGRLERAVADQRYALDQGARSMEHAVLTRLDRERNHLLRFRETLYALSPMNVLGRGYAILQGGDGNVISSCKQVLPGDPIDVVLRDGTVYASVTSTDRKEV